jgi:heme/copper-type cytochrome/quinol oxidase subunit 4
MNGIYYGDANFAGSDMPQKEDDGSPKFGRLLIVLIFAVLVCVGLTWVMATYFPNFPN